MGNFLYFCIWLFSIAAFANPAMKIGLLGGNEFQKGAPIAITYKVDNAPSTAYVGFYLRRELSKYESFQTPGPKGALSKLANKLSASGEGVFQWDGVSFGCDSPTCIKKPAEPGKYHFEAVLYEGEVSLVQLGAGHSGAPAPMARVTALTPSFSIVGDVNLDGLKQRLVSRAASVLAEQFELMNFQGTELERYVELNLPLSKPDRAGIYCEAVSFKEPFSGAGTACGPNTYDLSKLTFRGKPQIAAGKMSYKEAFAKAKEAADILYIPRVTFRDESSYQAFKQREIAEKRNLSSGTYLSSSAVNWAYRAEGKHWVFIISENEAGGSEAITRRFSDQVMVRVPDSGPACVVKTFYYGRGRAHGDVFKDAIACPKDLHFPN